MTTLKKRMLTCMMAMAITLVAMAQKGTMTVRGTVRDDKGAAVEFATVSLNQAFYAVTKAGGQFEMKNVPAGTYAWRVSFVGYETATGQLAVKSNPTTLNVRLHELTLELNDVIVTAQQVQMGSKSLIDQEAIRHIQPKSLGDVLQLMPGNLVKNPNLNDLSQANIREIGGNANNALGTSVVVDGTPLSNDANLEVLSATRHGSSAGDNGSTVGANATAGRGVDLRTVSTGTIEGVEIIRGIPSVEYGNLTSGVVIVNTKAGHTPWEAKLQVDPNSKLAYLSKGFGLTQGGAVNFAVDWAQSWSDTRIHYKGYDRLTASAGYSNQFGGLTVNVRGSFFTSINNTKRDPQMLEAYSEWKNSNTGGRLSVNGRFRSDRTFLTGIDYKLSGQLSRQYDWMSNWIYNPDGVITNTREQGMHEAWFKRLGYNSEYEIESVPLNIFAQVVANKYMRLNTNDEDHTTVKLGLEYTLDDNLGKGLTYDEANPPQAASAHRLRPRPYNDVPGLNTLSAFLSDNLALRLPLDMRLTAEAGVRVSNLFLNSSKSGGNKGFFVAEPRINASLSILNKDNNPFFDDLSVTGGWGLANKMPPLLYLYPDNAYFDHVAIGRWSENEASRMGLIQTTVISNTQNPDLRPMHSRKWEVGLSARKGRLSASLTYYNEHHTDEYGFMPQIMWVKYPYFTVEDGATNLAYDATYQQVYYDLGGVTKIADKQTYTERLSWSRPANTSQSHKQGIEYTIDLPEWKALRTSLNINGAWMWNKRRHNQEQYSNISVDNRLYTARPYMTVLPAGEGEVTTRLNTNFAFVTHIPAIKMVITTTLQAVWSETTQAFWEDEDGNNLYWLKSYSDRDYMVVTPKGYYDMDAAFHPWTAADNNSSVLNPHMARTQPYNLQKMTDDPWLMLCLRLTKELGHTGEISFIANNLTNTRKYRTNNLTGAVYQVYPPMYFGAEVKLKF